MIRLYSFVQHEHIIFEIICESNLETHLRWLKDIYMYDIEKDMTWSPDKRYTIEIYYWGYLFSIWRIENANSIQIIRIPCQQFFKNTLILYSTFSWKLISVLFTLNLNSFWKESSLFFMTCEKRSCMNTISELFLENHYNNDTNHDTIEDFDHLLCLQIYWL